MADVKITGLPAATTPVAGTEVLPIVQSGTTKQVSITNLTQRQVSIGASSTVLGSAQLSVNGTLPSTSNTSRVLVAAGTAPTTSTSEITGVYSNFATIDGIGAVATANMFYALPGTLTGGTRGAVANLYGFHAAANITAATANVGFFANVPAGTSRTITNVERTSNVVTITTSVAHGYTAGQSVTVAATTNTSLNGTFTITSTPATTTFTYAQTAADIPSGADTGSTVVVGRWNFYANGTAPNYFAADVRTNTTYLSTVSPTNSNTSATATAASLIAGIRTGTPAANIDLTLPLGTDMDAAFMSLQNNQAFQWSVINLAAATYNITVLANTGHTVVGNMVVGPASSGSFITRKTASNTFVTYRV